MSEEVSSSPEASPGFWSSLTTRQKVFIKTFSLLFVVLSISAIGVASVKDWQITGTFHITLTPPGDGNSTGEGHEVDIGTGSSSVDDDVCTTQACVEAAGTLLQNMNLSADPCTDFYEFACGKFMAETELPDDSSSIGVVSILNERIYRQIKAALEKKLKRGSRSIKMAQTAFKTCMNRVQVEELKTKHMLEMLEQLGHWPALRQDKWNGDNFDLTDLFVKLYQLDEGYNAFFDADVYNEPANSTYNILLMRSFKTFLEGKNNYDGTPEKADEMAAYRKLMFNVLKTLQMDAKTYTSDDDVTKEVDEIIDFETAISQMDTTSDFFTGTTRLRTLSKFLPKVQFDRFFRELVPDEVKDSISEDTRVIAIKYDLFETINTLIDEKGMKATVNYLIWRLVAKYIHYLDDRFEDIRHDYRYEMSAIEEMPRRWRGCIGFVRDFMPLAVGAVYVDEHFSPEDKKEAEKMVDMMQESFVELMKKNDWMDEKTKGKAVEKANNIIKNVGYPEFVKDDAKLDEFYKKVDIEETDSFFTLRMKRARFIRHKVFGTLNLKNNRDEFDASPAVINAHYTATQNAIVLNAALLQKPLYGGNVPKNINYGAAGYVIGHEITHGFDTNGRSYDNVGGQVDWWTTDSTLRFKKRAKCMIDQYNNISLPDTPFYVDGEESLGENIADGGGLRTAFHGYENYVKKNGKEKRLPGLQKYTNKQLLFASFAQFHCEKETLDSLEYNILTDPHAPAYARVLGTLSNMKEFSETFNCPIGSVYNPTHKCNVW